jgi:hypothetical protein
MGLNKYVKIGSKKDLLVLMLDTRVLRVRPEAILRLSNREVVNVGLDVLVEVSRSLVWLHISLIVSWSVV